MKIFISTDITVFQHGDLLYAQEKHATILKRYHDAFGKIILCSRAKKIDSVSKGYIDITNIVEDILVIGALLKMLLGTYKSQMTSKIKNCDLVIARCPSIAAYRAADCARKLNIPYLNLPFVLSDIIGYLFTDIISSKANFFNRFVHI